MVFTVIADGAGGFRRGHASTGADEGKREKEGTRVRRRRRRRRGRRDCGWEWTDGTGTERPGAGERVPLAVRAVVR